MSLLSGIGSELATVSLVLNLFLIILLLRLLKVAGLNPLKLLMGKEERPVAPPPPPNNPNSKPGNAQICKDMKEKMTKLKTAFDLKTVEFEKDIQEIKNLIQTFITEMRKNCSRRGEIFSDKLDKKQDKAR